MSIAHARVKVLALRTAHTVQSLPVHLVTWLNLADCSDLCAVPPSVSSMKLLEHLDVSSCNLAELPSWIGQLSCLRELVAAHNRIGELPGSLEMLKQLELLDVHDNPLTSSSLCLIERLISLQSLNISFTHVKTLSPSLYRLPRLEQILVEGTSRILSGSRDISQALDAKQYSSDPTALFYHGLEQPPYDVAAIGKAAVAAYFKALQGGGAAVVRLKVLVIGNSRAGKSKLVSYLSSRHMSGDNSIFTVTNEVTRPCFGSYSCSWIVVDCVKTNFMDTLTKQLDYAVAHCGVQDVSFVLTKNDLYGSNLIDTSSVIDMITNVAAAWIQERTNKLTVAGDEVKTMTRFVASRDLYLDLLERRREIEYKLHSLRNLRFSFVSTSAVTGDGIAVLAEMAHKITRGGLSEVFPQSWLQFQESCVGLSRRDCEVLHNHDFDVTRFLQIDEEVEDRRNRTALALSLLRCLVDAVIIQRIVARSEIMFVLANNRWFEKQLESLAVEPGCLHCQKGQVELKCVRKHFLNDSNKLRLFVVLLVYQGLCYESYFNDHDVRSSVVDLKSDKETIIENFLQDRCCLLLPWLLPEQQPETALVISDVFRETKVWITTMTYHSLCNIPFALFHELCISVRNLPHTKCLHHWRRGITLRSGDSAVSLEDITTSSKAEREVRISFGFGGYGSNTLLSQFWSFISSVILIVETHLKEWKWTITRRCCQCNNFRSLEVAAKWSVSLLREPDVVGDGAYLLLKMKQQESGLRPGNCTGQEIVAVFSYSHVNEVNETQTNRFPRNFGSSSVRDGISASSTSVASSRNVTIDPPGRRPDHPQMENEQKRLESFRRWPRFAVLSAESLVKLGFFYSGVRDEVVCYNCGIRLGLWERHPDPITRHTSKSPDCEVAYQSRFSNIIGSSTNVASVTPTAPEKFTYPATPQVTPDLEEISSWSRPLLGMQSTPHSAIAGSENTEVLSKAHSTEAGRLASFDNRLSTFDHRWPTSCPVKPVDLARAGFFFTGQADSVQCFSCHVALRGWVEGDTAEGEHRLHAPYCPFLNRLGTDGRSTCYLPHDVEPHNHPREREPDTIAYNDEDMRSEYRRLASFQRASWLSTVSISAEEMAAAGLYSAYGDTVRCFHCHVMIAAWVPRDVPIEEHIKHSPECRFARAVAQRIRVQQTETSASATAERMADRSTRLSSFVNWPRSAPVDPVSLATAGFYYVGNGDRVRCFSCGGALKNWEAGDTPWREHGRWFPLCEFFQRNAPSEVAVVAAGYDEPWSHVATTSSSLSESRKGSLPPWSLMVERRSPESQVTSLQPAPEPPRQVGVNQDFLEIAIQMDFHRAIAERVIALNMQSKDSPYTDFNEFIDDVIKAEEEAASSKAESLASAAEMVSKPSWTTKEAEKSRSPLASLDEMLGALQSSHGGTSKEEGMRLSPEIPQPMETYSSPPSGTSPAGSLGHVLDSTSTGQRLPSAARETDRLRALEDRRLCKVCMDHEIAVVFLDCGHVVCCDECSRKVIECPICRQPIKSRIRAFFS